MNIVGTPRNAVTCCSAQSCSAVAASKRGSSTIVAPRRSVVFITTVWPNVWNSGRPPNTTSSSRRSNTSMMQTLTCSTSAKCDPTAPLGCPVVPLVNRMVAGSRGFVATTASSGSPSDASAVSERTSSPAATPTTSAPVSAAAGPASPSTDPAAMSTRAPELLRTWVISSTLEQQVDRHDDGAHREDGEVGHQELGHVRQHHRHPVAALDAAGAQAPGGLPDPLPQVAVRQFVDAVGQRGDDGGLGVVPSGALGHDRGDVQCSQSGGGGHRAPLRRCGHRRPRWGRWWDDTRAVVGCVRPPDATQRGRSACSPRSAGTGAFRHDDGREARGDPATGLPSVLVCAGQAWSVLLSATRSASGSSGSAAPEASRGSGSAPGTGWCSSSPGAQLDGVLAEHAAEAAARGDEPLRDGAGLERLRRDLGAVLAEQHLVESAARRSRRRRRCRS